MHHAYGIDAVHLPQLDCGAPGSAAQLRAMNARAVQLPEIPPPPDRIGMANGRNRRGGPDFVGTFLRTRANVPTGCHTDAIGSPRSDPLEHPGGYAVL